VENFAAESSVAFASQQTMFIEWIARKTAPAGVESLAKTLAEIRNENAAPCVLKSRQDRRFLRNGLWS
jgi:hypothetical protein